MSDHGDGGSGYSDYDDEESDEDSEPEPGTDCSLFFFIRLIKWLRLRNTSDFITE